MKILSLPIFIVTLSLIVTSCQNNQSNKEVAMCLSSFGLYCLGTPWCHQFTFSAITFICYVFEVRIYAAQANIEEQKDFISIEMLIFQVLISNLKINQEEEVVVVIVVALVVVLEME